MADVGVIDLVEDGNLAKHAFEFVFFHFTEIDDFDGAIVFRGNVLGDVDARECTGTDLFHDSEVVNDASLFCGVRSCHRRIVRAVQ